MQSEIEAELQALRRELAELQARDEARVKQIRPLVKATSLIVVLFALTAAVVIVAAAWTGQSGMIQLMYPVLFAGISLSFLNSALRAWRPAEVRAIHSSPR